MSKPHRALSPPAYASAARRKAFAVVELKDLVLRQDNSTIIAAYSWYLDHVANHFAQMQLAGNIEAKILVELKTLIESIMATEQHLPSPHLQSLREQPITVITCCQG
jgi:hypothetical protein